VGVQLGTTGDIWLTDNTEAEVVRYDENTLAFQALANGDVDAAMADGPTAVDLIKANPEMDLKVLDGVYTEEQYGIAVNPERQDVLEAINEGLAAVKESGEYDEIYDEYFSTEGLAEEEEEEAGADLGTVTIGTNAEYPPFEFVDDEGEITGFDVELMAAIAEAAGFDYEFVNTRWDGIFVALASGEFDAVISAATITEEREEMVDFSDPYFNAGQRLAVRADETEIQGPDDLAGKKVGVQLGTTGDIWLTDNTEAEVVRYDENTLAFQALANGDVDAAMADGPTAVDIVKANPEMDLTVLDGVYTEEQYGIAVNPERQDVLEAINEGLAAVKESGKYDEIYDKYFGTE
jgi:polar amino acid transport system substrate-binding protein